MDNRYKTIDLKRCLQFLLDIAYERNLNNKELIEGIYDYRSFNRIVSGQKSVTLNIIVKLAEKLDVPIGVVLANANTLSYKRVTEIRKTLDYYITKKQFDKLEELLTYVEQFHLDDSIIKQQYLKIKTIIYIEINHDYDLARATALEALSLTYPDFEEETCRISYMDDEEISLLNLLSMIHCYRREIDEALSISKRICEKALIDEKFTIIYAFLIAMQCFYMKEDYNMMEILGLRVLKIIDRNFYYQLLGDDYFMLCKCYIMMNNQRQFNLYYHKLLLYCEISGNDMSRELAKIRELSNPEWLKPSNLNVY